MFRSAHQIEVEAAAKKLAGFRDHWKLTADKWYDGTPASVDQRIAKLDQVIAFAGRQAQSADNEVGNFCLAALPNLKANREELVELRRQLLGGDTGLITGPEDAGIQPLSPSTLTDMRNNISNWNSDNDIFSSRKTAGWFPGGDEEAAGYNLDPRMYPSHRDWMDASNLRSYIQDAQERNPGAGDYPIPARDERLMSAALDFIESQNTDDREELLIRAQRFMAERTGSWTPESSQAATRDFLGAVSAQVPRQVRQANRAEAAVVEDFDDALMFS